MGALAASADRVPNADLLLLAAKEAKALPEGAAGSSAHHAILYIVSLPTITLPGWHCLSTDIRAATAASMLILAYIHGHSHLRGIQYHTQVWHMINQGLCCLTQLAWPTKPAARKGTFDDALCNTLLRPQLGVKSSAPALLSAPEAFPLSSASPCCAGAASGSAASFGSSGAAPS